MSKGASILVQSVMNSNEPPGSADTSPIAINLNENRRQNVVSVYQLEYIKSSAIKI